MSSQKGNVTRSRPQRHQNTFSFKMTSLIRVFRPSNQRCFNYSDQLFSKEKHIIRLLVVLLVAKKINAKLHDGVCQRCKEVLEWRVKYSKYKPLSKPKKCVKCLQKTVKDSYHIMCRPCACEFEVCAKCGKREDVVIPFNKEPEKTENVENNLHSSHRRSCRRNEENDDDLDFDIDLDDTEEDN